MATAEQGRRPHGNVCLLGRLSGGSEFGGAVWAGPVSLLPGVRRARGRGVGC